MNVNLSTWALCLKAVSLTALTFMLRPSDVALRSSSGSEELFPNEFNRDCSEFKDDHVVVYLFGIKNDYDRKGFRFSVPMASDPVICRVRALKDCEHNIW